MLKLEPMAVGFLSLTLFTGRLMAGSPCDLNNDNVVDVQDIQLGVNQALGITSCSQADLNGDGKCNVPDVQIIVNAVISGVCAAAVPTILQTSPSTISAPAGQTVSLTYNWRAIPLPKDYTVFVHFLSSSGQIVFGDDHTPPVSTSQWSGPVSYSRTVTVPASTASGSYFIDVGLYDASNTTALLNPGPGVIGDVDPQHESPHAYRVGALTVTASNDELTGFMTFSQATASFAMLSDYEFGTATGRNMSDLATLGNVFDNYGIAGTTVINQEWERYQTFNPTNFVLTPTSLDLTAVIAPGGGLFSGGITSGQIFTKQTYQPGVSGHQTYATEVRMQVPSGPGMWPASWFYVKTPGMTDSSEIDNPEFFNDANQNNFDWTGFTHGPGAGADFYSIMTNQWVWHPGMDFSAAFHNYQTVWTQTAVYRYVDDVLVRATHFTWTAAGQAQFIVNLAVGTDDTTNLPGLQPTSTNQFPAKLSIDHIKIMGN